MNIETVELNEKHKQRACDLINKVFQEVGIVDRILPNDIQFTDSMLMNKSVLKFDSLTNEHVLKLDRKLTDIIFNHYYSIPAEKLFYHYTTISGFNNIINESKLKLSPLIKNSQYDEFNTFYMDHKLKGYDLTRAESGKLMKDELMEQTYSISFARKIGLKAENDQSLWRSFGDNGGGVRIEFQIETNHIDFRNVFYLDKNFNKDELLLNKLTSLVQQEFNRTFAIRAVSKIGSFYLPGDYKIENETRYIIKKDTDDYDLMSYGLDAQKEAECKRIFRDIFPQTYKVFSFIKRKNSSHLPIILQRMESKLILDHAAKLISVEKPEMPLFTIHDSIVCPVGYENYVSTVIKEEAHKAISEIPNLGFDYWSSDKLKF